MSFIKTNSLLLLCYLSLGQLSLVISTRFSRRRFAISFQRRSYTLKMECETSQNQPKSIFKGIESPALISFSPFRTRECTHSPKPKEWFQAEISQKCFEESSSKKVLSSPEVFPCILQSFSPNKWTQGIDSKSTPVSIKGHLNILNNKDQVKRKIYKSPDSKSYLEEFSTSLCGNPRNSTPLDAMKISPFDSRISIGQLLNFNEINSSNNCSEWTTTIGISEQFSKADFEEIDSCVNSLDVENEISETTKNNFHDTDIESTVSMYVTANHLNNSTSIKNSEKDTELNIVESSLLSERKKVTKLNPMNTNKPSEYFSTPDFDEHFYNVDSDYSNENESHLGSIDNSRANSISDQVDLENLNEGVLSNSAVYEKLSDILTNGSSGEVKACSNPLDLSQIHHVKPTFENKDEKFFFGLHPNMKELIETEKSFKDNVNTSIDAERTQIASENTFMEENILCHRRPNECIFKKESKESSMFDGSLSTDFNMELKDASNSTTSGKDLFFSSADSDSLSEQRSYAILEESSNCSVETDFSKSAMCTEESNYWEDEDSINSIMCKEKIDYSKNKDCDRGIMCKVPGVLKRISPDEYCDASRFPETYLPISSSPEVTVNTESRDRVHGVPYAVYVKPIDLEKDSENGEMAIKKNFRIQDVNDHVILKELHVSQRQLLNKKEFPAAYTTSSQILNSQNSKSKETAESQDVASAPKEFHPFGLFLEGTKVKTEVDEKFDEFPESFPYSSHNWAMKPVNYENIENNSFKSEKKRDTCSAEDYVYLSDFDEKPNCKDSIEMAPMQNKPYAIRHFNPIKKENTDMRISHISKSTFAPLIRRANNLKECENIDISESSEMDTFTSSSNFSADEPQCSRAKVKNKQRIKSKGSPLGALFDIDKIVSKAVIKAITELDQGKGTNCCEIMKYLKQHKLMRLQAKLNQDVEKFLKVSSEVGILKQKGRKYYLSVVSKSSSYEAKKPLKRVILKKQKKQVVCKAKTQLSKNVQSLKKRATNTPIYSPKFLRNKRVLSLTKDDTPNTGNKIFKKLRSRVILAKNKF